MNLTTEHVHGVSVVRVKEPRILYPLLAQFTESITMLIDTGERRVLLDLSAVTSIDSAAVGCLLGLSQQMGETGGRLMLTGLQKRVEALLEMTGAQNALEIHGDESEGIRSFD